MYIYLENNYFIPLFEIIAVVDYEHFIKSEEAKEFLSKNKNKTIVFENEDKRTLIITDKYLYISAYTARTLQSRGYEFKKIKNQTNKSEVK